MTSHDDNFSFSFFFDGDDKCWSIFYSNLTQKSTCVVFFFFYFYFKCMTNEYEVKEKRKTMKIRLVDQMNQWRHLSIDFYSFSVIVVFFIKEKTYIHTYIFNFFEQSLCCFDIWKKNSFDPENFFVSILCFFIQTISKWINLNIFLSD